MKRVSYSQVTITVPGANITIEPADAGGWRLEVQLKNKVTFGKDLPEAAESMISELQRVVNHIAEDVRVFIERNK